MALLEYFIRNDLNQRAPRAMAVLRPLKVVLLNYPEAQEEELKAINNPEDPNAGTRQVPFSREIYIEREDLWRTHPENSSAWHQGVKSGSAMPISSRVWMW